jgi:rhodanese-related sulfurtransferase
MKLQQARWIGLFAVALSVTACAKSEVEGASKEGAKAAEAKPAEVKAATFGRLTLTDLQSRMAAAKAGKLALFIFDNNGKERFEQGHIPGAKWVQFSDVKAADLPADKEATLVFYCASEQCSACHSGASAAMALGYKNVFILPEGINGWEKAQQPIEKV